MTNQNWIEHAYPLQQIVIRLQGTRHSRREDIINQLETVLSRLRAGDVNGTDHDDDFGYVFESVGSSPGLSFFNESTDFR
ncbi:hypothetical protein SAMN05216339_101422 [Nitrosomonas eutropha]|uniref:Uncharacterized protein n=1 Tax=Nitrosomonas eutropha TaxID=916 RepID=A0A1I7FCX3_9PROT|nr:hypothetical protein [Nitrosomonas eutropha]SFU34032.1 hypothetical protein SAMN05216339_101422 [Nitrosomonas eutropha]